MAYRITCADEKTARLVAAALYIGAKAQLEAAPLSCQHAVENNQPTVTVSEEDYGEWLVEVDDFKGEMNEMTPEEAVAFWEESDQG
jgi:hypothetical protein